MSAGPHAFRDLTRRQREARPADSQGPDPEQLRDVVAVLLDENPSAPNRAALAAEVAAEARSVLAGPATTRSLRRAGDLVAVALDVLEAPSVPER